MSQQEARTTPSDIFSLGMTIYEMMSGGPPFPGESDAQVMIRILKGDRPSHPGADATVRGLTDLLWKFVQLSWAPDRKERPSLKDLHQVLDGEHSALKNRPEPQPGNIFDGREFTPRHFRDLMDSSPISLMHAARQGNEAVHDGLVSDIWAGVLRNGTKVAMKVLRVSSRNRDAYQLLLTRLSETSHLRHENLLDALGIHPLWREARFAVLYEWMTNGSLDFYINSNSNVNHVQLVRGIGAGLQFLHSQDIVHGDLTPKNILVREDGTAALRSFSFEFCVEPYPDAESNSIVYGALRWQPPERLQPEDFGLQDNDRLKPSDMYTFSMTIYNVLFHQVPFFLARRFRLVDDIMSGIRPTLTLAGKAEARGMTPKLREFMEKCWLQKYDERPSIEEFTNIWLDVDVPVPR